MPGYFGIGRILAAASTAAFLVACSASPGSSLPRGAAGSADSAGMGSVAAKSLAAADDHDGVKIKLLEPLQADDQMDLTRSDRDCDRDLDVDDAPAFYAQTTAYVSQPTPYTIKACKRHDGDGSGDDDRHHTKANIDIIMIDTSTDPHAVYGIDGPATEADGYWTFYALTKDVFFQQGHIYRFFVARVKGTLPTGGD